jgi:RecB family endonuclease NucS
MSKIYRRHRERKIQKLLRAHPYLLDAELSSCRGRIERRVENGRLDIDFQTEKGWIVVECKCTALTDEDLKQLCRYIDDLANTGRLVHKAYLVGKTPRKGLDRELLEHSPGITLRHIVKDIPTFLAFSEGRHYFDADMDLCPYDGTRRMVGKELSLE